MKQYTKKLQLETKKQFEIVDITSSVKNLILESGITSGVAYIFCQHTTASIRLNHNEPLLLQDIMKALYRLVPIDQSYNHDLFEVRQNIAPNERSNGHAHVKAFLLGSSETIPVEAKTLALRSKQSLFFIELDGGRSRAVDVKIIGD